MGRYLIVANQTLGGEDLDRVVRDRIARGEARFHIVVPATPPKHETKAWQGGFFVTEGMTADQFEEVRRAMEEEERQREALDAEAQRRAEDRLRRMVDRIQAVGGEAEGAVGDADPVAAVRNVLAERSFDEVIISTLPAGLSRWLRMDLPRRVARVTDAPVTSVEAAAEEEAAASG